jgi:hypothetical protein
MLKRDPLTSAMETSDERENPRWDEEEEDDTAEKGTNDGIRVFTLAKHALFISMY